MAQTLGLHGLRGHGGEASPSRSGLLEPGVERERAATLVLKAE